MRIGIILYPTFGGSGVVATELGMALAGIGHEVHFFSTARPFRLPAFKPNAFFHEVPVVQYSLFEHTPYTLTLATTLFEAISLYKLDVIHAHYAIPHATAAYLAREMNGGWPPIITTLHGTDVTLVGSHSAYAPVVKFTLEKSDAVTAVSNHLAHETCKSINYTGDIQVVYNFVDTEVYSRKCCEIPREPFAPNGEPIVIHMSNFRPVKRIQDVMSAFVKVRRQRNCKLLLVGDGPERSGAEQTARAEGVTDDVFFLGNQTAIVDLLGISDVLLQPSETESFGVSILEGMACEVPVVATRVGGVPEVVADGECGFLTDLGDTDTMAARILQLVNHPEQARQMGQAGRARAKEVFHQDKIVAQYESLYESVIARSPCPEPNFMSSKSKIM